MLGLGKEKLSWHWAVSGKHPLAADYFHSGMESQLHQAFASWVEEGFAALPNTDEARHAICFWRFWVRGARKGSVICGLLKASSDRIGRPYPLLIIGVGNLNGWEKNWTYLPAGLDTIWQQAEYIAAKRFNSLEELSEAICKISSPDPDMLNALETREFEKEPEMPGGSIETPPNINFLMQQLNEQRVVRVSLAAQTQSVSDAAVRWSLRLKIQGADVPQAFFFGGSPGQQFLMMFMRSLNKADFINLWSV